MIWDILENKIASAGLAIPGKSLFRHAMPSDVAFGVMFKNPLSGIPVDPYIPEFYQTDIQVIVRHAKIEKGQQIAAAIVAALTVTGEEYYAATPDRGRVYIKRFFPKTLPIQYPRLDGKSYEWSLNFSSAFTIQTT